MDISQQIKKFDAENKPFYMQEMEREAVVEMADEQTGQIMQGM